MLYTHDLRNSMNERTHFFIKIYLSHFILERVDVSVVCERWVARHILRERTSSFHIFFQEPGVANACTPLQARQRRLCSAACPTLDCDSLHTVYIWPRGSHHVIPFRLHTCSTWVPRRAVIFLFTNQNVTAYQSTRGHYEQTKYPCHMLYNTKATHHLKVHKLSCQLKQLAIGKDNEA